MYLCVFIIYILSNIIIMTICKGIFTIIGLVLILGIAIFITQYATREQMNRGKFADATVLGFTTFNESCYICSGRCAGLFFGIWGCECRSYLFTGGLVVNYTNPNIPKSLCDTNVKISTACGNTIDQALFAVEDVYAIGETIEGYSSTMCSFVLQLNRLLVVWIFASIFIGLFIILTTIAICQCCRLRRHNAQQKSQLFSTNSHNNNRGYGYGNGYGNNYQHV